MNLAKFNPTPKELTYACALHYNQMAHDTFETAVKYKIMAGVSCEPGRKQAYSNDLRWRMVWQREVLGYKYDHIAVNLNVHPSTVCRVTKLFSTSGSVDHKPYLRDKLFRSF